MKSFRHLAIFFSFFLFLTIGLVSAPFGYNNLGNLIATEFGYDNILSDGTGNSSAYNVNHSTTSDYATTAGSAALWDGLNSPADIQHNLLDNLEWSLSGHTMDANLDMNSYNIQEIDKAYFSGTDFISSDDNDHLDIHADYIDLHGNLSTIWTVMLNTDGDGYGGDAFGDLVFGSGRDVYLYYNGSDFIIDPDAVGSGDVVIFGDIRADNFIGNFSGTFDGVNISNLSNQYVPYTGATRNVNLGTNNITADWGFFNSINVSNNSIYIGNVKISTDGNDLNVSSNITALSYKGDGSQLTNLNLTGIDINAGSINATGNITADYGFFNYLGSLINRIKKGWFVDLDVSGDLNVTGNTILAGVLHISNGSYIKVGNVTTGAITENRIFAEGTIVAHSGFSSKNSDWEPYFKMFDSTSTTTKSGSNGKFDDSENIFCDSIYDGFVPGDATKPGKTLTLLNGTHVGAIAQVWAYVNSSCIELKNNPGWDMDINEGVKWSMKTGLIVDFNDGNSYRFVVGSDKNSWFRIGIPNGTGFNGISILDVAGADQHQALTLDMDIKDYDGVVALNIFGESSTGGEDVSSQFILMESRAFGLNNSDLTYISMNTIGSGGNNNEVDGIRASPFINHLIHVGSADSISKVYDVGVDITTEVTDGGNAEVFTNDDDVLYIGATVNFTTVSFALDTESSANAIFDYYYCNGAGNWVTLIVGADTTNGFTISGTLNFPSPIDRGVCNKQIDGTPFANTTDYAYIALQRTKNNIITPPILDTITIAGATDSFVLQKDLMKLNPVDTAPETCDASMLGGIYFDISEDDMCVCKSTGWKVMTDGTACT